MEEVQKAFQEGMQTGVYKSPFATDRTLNSTGGRVGFANGGLTFNTMEEAAEFEKQKDLLKKAQEKLNELEKKLEKLSS